MRSHSSFVISLLLMIFLLCVLSLPDEVFVLFASVFTDALFATLFTVALASELFIIAVIHIHYHGLIKSKNKQFGLILLNAHLLVGAIQLTAHLWPELTLWTNAAISFGLLIFLNLPLFLVLPLFGVRLCFDPEAWDHAVSLWLRAFQKVEKPLFFECF